MDALTEAALDYARADARHAWNSEHPELVYDLADDDVDLVETVWDAAWAAALEAQERLAGGP